MHCKKVMQIHRIRIVKLFLFILRISSVQSSNNSDTLHPAILVPGPISHLVLLRMSKSHLSYSRNCVGAILSDQLILTTTQCLIYGNEKFKPDEIKVEAASDYLYDQSYPGETQYDVKKIITNYNDTHHCCNEFALLQLKSPIKLNEPIGRIGLIDLVITSSTGGAPKWCKKKVKKTPYKLHVRTGKKNCGESRVYRGKYIIYVCVKRGKISTEYCYGASGAPLHLIDILAGLKIAISKA